MAETARAGHLRRTYGITEAQYDAILKYQGGVCGVCDKPPGNRRLEVDHDHTTGLIRGLLCWYCNKKRIGRETNPNVFDWAALYLRNPPAQDIIGAHVVPPKKRKKRSKKNGK